MNIPEKRDQASREDLARSTLQTILNNIGQIGRDCAKNYVILYFKIILIKNQSKPSIDLIIRNFPGLNSFL